MLERALKVLKKHYGYSEFREHQGEIIESILKGQDTMAIMPTGAGKSICFQIPALLFEGVTLVISPLISLMKDQVDALKQLGIGAAYINSSLDSLEIQEIMFYASQGEYKLIYIAPERLESEAFCKLISNLNISLVAIDEAHCLSQWGHDFRKSYREIIYFINKLPKRPTVAAFTATATETVRKDILDLLSLTDPKVFVTGFDRKNLNFSVIRGEDRDKFLYEYVSNNKGKTGIIYTSTRKEAERLQKKLKEKGHKVGVYHAGFSEQERSKVQEDFSYDKIDIIVATNAFGMGIDKSNVRYVIHYNIPKNIEAYYQEAGRAGRDGEGSECVLLFAPKDIQVQKFFIDESSLSEDKKNYEYNKLRDMVDYCYTSKCLRAYILDYFGEKQLYENCDNCSNCNDTREEKDVTIEAQKIFSCVYRMKERYGVNMIADVLKGSKNKKILSLGLDQLSTYGIMEQTTQKYIASLVNKLIAEKYLLMTDDMYPVVKLKPKSRAVLQGQEKVLMKITKVSKVVEVDNNLFTILGSLRRVISLRESVPPFMIFHDATLKEMSQCMPSTLKDLLNIKGVGERKAQVYGEEFLQEINKYMEENNIEPPVKIEGPEGEVRPSEKEEKIKTHQITYNLYREGMELKGIAKERGLTILTVQEHIFRCLMEGMEVNIDDFIQKSYEDIILDTIKSIGGDKLKPIKDALPDEVDYMSIKAVWYKYKSAI